MKNPWIEPGTPVTNKRTGESRIFMDRYVSAVYWTAIGHEHDHLCVTPIAIKFVHAYNALLELCDLKRHKDAHGKDEYYREQQPGVWERAFRTLRELQDPS